MVEGGEAIVHYQQRNAKGEFMRMNPVHIKHKAEIEAYMNRDKNPLPPGLAVSMVARDVRFRHEREKKHELSTEDSLTGLNNRRFVFGDESKPNPSGELRRLFLEANREGKPLSVIMMDIDNFKEVNDSYSHKAGDFVLKQLAEVIKKTIRKSDITARIGGDEFFLILPNTDLTGAKELAEKIRARVEDNDLNPDRKENTPNKITISVGVSTLTEESRIIKTENDLYKTADKSLHFAKGAGRNQVYVTDEITLDDGKIIFHFHEASIERKKPSGLQVLLRELRRKYF